MKISQTLLVAAVGGLFAGTAACGSNPPPTPSDPSSSATPSAPSAPSTPSTASAPGAASDKHACKGQNACKGQGFSAMTKEKCAAAKGKFTPS